MAAATSLARKGPNVRDPAFRTLPVLWRIADVESSISAAGTGSAISYVWRAPLLLTAFWFGVASGDSADLAGLELSWQADGDPIGIAGTQMVSFPGYALFSQAHWVPLKRSVKAHDVHVFQFTNNGANAVVPRLFFRVQCIAGEVCP